MDESLTGYVKISGWSHYKDPKATGTHRASIYCGEGSPLERYSLYYLGEVYPIPASELSQAIDDFNWHKIQGWHCGISGLHINLEDMENKVLNPRWAYANRVDKPDEAKIPIETYLLNPNFGMF